MKFYKETEFKETPIGKIPKKWKITNLGSIAKIYAGNTAPQDEKYFKNGKYPFIRVQHLTVLQEQKYPVKYDLINEYAVSDLKLKKFKKGSIIFPKSGESIRLEKRAILKEDSYVVNHLAVVEPFHENIDNLFLFYYLCTVKTSNYLLKTTMPSLNLSTISNFLVPLPPIKEQQTIAEILSTVDKAIQRTDEIIAKTERLKKALMNELLMGRIRVREENGKPVFYRETEFQETEIGKIPREWKTVKLKEILILRNGKRPTLSEKGWIPVYGANGIMGYTTDFLIDNDYTIVIGRVGASGEVHLVQGKIWVSDNALYSEKFNSSKVFMPFLYYLLKDKKLGRFAHKTTHPIITQSFLNNLLIQLPSLAEQRIIADILLTIDGAIELYCKEKNTLGRLKKGLMDVLLTGKIRVVED
jgi:type I restriction enzyme S subunit